MRYNQAKRDYTSKNCAQRHCASHQLAALLHYFSAVMPAERIVQYGRALLKNLRKNIRDFCNLTK